MRIEAIGPVLYQIDDNEQRNKIVVFNGAQVIQYSGRGDGQLQATPIGEDGGVHQFVTISTKEITIYTLSQEISTS